jgi:methionine synthase I (cobalamin-dependent)
MGTFFIERGVALPRFTEGRFPYDTSPEYFASVAVGITHWGAKLRGCGTRREHIGTLANALASTQRTAG